jgi:hypothetical protein
MDYGRDGVLLCMCSRELVFSMYTYSNSSLKNGTYKEDFSYTLLRFSMYAVGPCIPLPSCLAVSYKERLEGGGG